MWHSRLRAAPGADQPGGDWLGRLQALFGTLPSTQYCAYTVQAVELLDVPLSAVDFHVCSIVDELAGADRHCTHTTHSAHTLHILRTHYTFCAHTALTLK